MSTQPNVIQPTTPPKDPGTVLLLNLFTAGGGYLYIGQTTKGIIMIVVTLIGLCFCVGIVVPLFTCIDGYLLAKKLKEGESIGQWQFCWTQSPRVKRLIFALQQAPDEQVQSIQDSLIAEGQNAYTQLADESGKPLSPVGSTRIVQTLERYESQASTKELIESFTKVYAIKDEWRPAISTRAEVALLARGPSVVPELLPLLDNVAEADRFYTIRLLSALGDPQTVQPLLKRVREDSNPNCRMAALLSFMGYAQPDLGMQLVEAMKEEAKRTYKEITNEQMARWTKMGLGLLSGDFGIGGLITRGAGSLLQRDLAKASAKERLQAFGGAYSEVWISSKQPIPIDALLSAANDIDNNVKAFMILHAALLIGNLTDDEQRKQVTNAVMNAAHDASAEVRKSAIAGLASVNTPEAADALKQLAESNDIAVRADVAKVLEMKQPQSQQSYQG